MLPEQALRLGSPAQLRYRGAPMLRPIASNEVPVLARALVRASEAANRALGLDAPEEQSAPDQDVRSGNGVLQVTLHEEQPVVVPAPPEQKGACPAAACMPLQGLQRLQTCCTCAANMGVSAVACLLEY